MRILSYREIIADVAADVYEGERGECLDDI